MKVNPFPGQELRSVDFGDSDYDTTSQRADDVEDANLVTSKVAGRVFRHKPVLDIDFPAQLVPSSTPGHFHLFLDKEMEDETYWKLLEALADAGVIEHGYFKASVRRGFTAVRLPWVKKNQESGP